MSRHPYDGAVTLFSKGGHLLQVEYAQEAVQRGNTVIAVRGADCIVMGAIQKPMQKLQIERTSKKILVIHEQIILTFAGVAADSRGLIALLRAECQYQRVTLEKQPSMDHIVKFVANRLHKSTLTYGMRPLGVTFLIGGFDGVDGAPHLYQVDPSGAAYEWVANSTGQNYRTVLQFLEKNYCEEAVASAEGTIKLAISALLAVLPADHNLEFVILRRDCPLRKLDSHCIKQYIFEIQREKEIKAMQRKMAPQCL